MSDSLDFGIDLDDVTARLAALGYFLTIEPYLSAAEAIRTDLAVPPVAYVSVASETAQPNKHIGGYRQEVFVQLSILFAEAIIRADRAADDTVERTRKAIIRQLTGWQPKGAKDALAYDRYVMRMTDDRAVWGEVLFRTRYTFTQ